jgi:hypothetical protein
MSTLLNGHNKERKINWGGWISRLSNKRKYCYNYVIERLSCVARLLMWEISDKCPLGDEIKG